MLKQELAVLRNTVFRLNPIQDYNYFTDRYWEYELCSTVVDFLTGIDWQTSIDRDLLYIIDRYTDRGKFLKSLVEWVKGEPTRHAQSIREIINGFVLDAKKTWPHRFGVLFGIAEPFEHRVADRLALSLYRFRGELGRIDAGLVFDAALPISLLTYILGYEAVIDVYDLDALVILDRLNFEGILIYHVVKWVEDSGLPYLYKGESYLSAAARFADHIISLANGGSSE